MERPFLGRSFFEVQWDGWQAIRNNFKQYAENY